MYFLLNYIKFKIKIHNYFIYISTFFNKRLKSKRAVQFLNLYVPILDWIFQTNFYRNKSHKNQNTKVYFKSSILLDTTIKQTEIYTLTVLFSQMF